MVYGTLEVREYENELRNQLIIFKNNKESNTAFISVLLPPRRGMETPMLEITNDEMFQNCCSYFNLVWRLHKDDVLTIS